MLSLRRIKVANNLFYASTAAAEAAMARSEAVIKANAKRQAGYKHGLRSLRARATKLGALPAARINFQPPGRDICGDLFFDFVALLGDESRILWRQLWRGLALRRGFSLHHDHARSQGLPRARRHPHQHHPRAGAAANGYARQHDSLFVMNRTPDSDIAEYLMEEFRYGSEDYSFSGDYPLINRWKSLPPPHFIYRSDYTLPADIGGHAVVGSTIYVSSVASRIGTYSFDTAKWMWSRAGEWTLPFLGKAEFVPELNLWFGLSRYRPFHLCAADLSALDFQRGTKVQHTWDWVDFDMPKNWKPMELDLVSLGSGRFCIVKTFLGTLPPLEVGFSDEEDDGDEIELTDTIAWEFAVLTGIEVVRSCDDSVRMIKHKSRYYIFEDHGIKWVL